MSQYHFFISSVFEPKLGIFEDQKYPRNSKTKRGFKVIFKILDILKETLND